jgi:hypothetical protein
MKRYSCLFYPVKYSIVLVVALVVALLGTLAYVPPTASVYASEDTPISVLASDVQTDFPYSISFSLQAESSAAPITEVELLYGATRHESLTVVKVDFEPGQQIETEHLLDTQVYYFPPGVDMTYRWIIRDEEGNVLETPPQTFLYHDERFDWKERTVQGLTVYWYEGNDSFGDELINTAERALNDLQREIGSDLTEPAKIYIYANSRDLYSAMQTNEVEWVGGQAHLSLGLIVGSIAPGDSQEIGRLVPHELSHLVLEQATDNPYGGVPLWFHEGLAVYNQDLVEPYFSVVLEEAALNGELIALEALASSFPADPDKALLSYAQSHSMLAYIIDTYGTEKMHELVDAFGEGITVEEAVQQALGMSVDELDAAWRETQPAAQVSTEPTEEPVIRAPADRFSSSPVMSPPSPALHGGPATAKPVSAPPRALAVPDMGIPMWAQLGLAAGCCTVLLTLTGATLLVALRFIGVDKRVD